MRPGDLDTGDRLLTAEEAAVAVGVATATWHRSVARGSYPGPDGHVGRTPVWRAAVVEALAARRTAS